MKEDLSSVLVSSRANEKKHSIEEDETNTVSIDRQDIKSKIKEENEQNKLHKRCKYRLLMSIIFKRAKHKSMNHLRKTFKKKKFAIALILLLLVASLFGFIAMGMFGSKYAEVPDLKGKTEKKRKNTATISFRNW